MRKLLTAAAVLTLLACGGPSPEPALPASGSPALVDPARIGQALEGDEEVLEERALGPLAMNDTQYTLREDQLPRRRLLSGR